MKLVALTTATKRKIGCDVLFQRTFVPDLYLGKHNKNSDELEKLLIRVHHPPIVNRELFAIANRAEK